MAIVVVRNPTASFWAVPSIMVGGHGAAALRSKILLHFWEQMAFFPHHLVSGATSRHQASEHDDTRRTDRSMNERVKDRQTDTK